MFRGVGVGLGVWTFAWTYTMASAYTTVGLVRHSFEPSLLGSSSAWTDLPSPNGAVWFTLSALSAETYTEGTTRKIKTSDAIIPIATTVAASLGTAFTFGTSAVAAGAAGGATAVAAGTLGSSVVGVSSALVAAGGIPATSAPAVGGALVGGTMSQAVVGPVMKTIFKKENVMASKMGCYARRCPTCTRSLEVLTLKK